jgi:hypothetical protein
MDYSPSELLYFARHAAGDGESSNAAEAEHYSISALLALALQALNGSETDNRAADWMANRSRPSITMREAEFGLTTELQQQLRLIEQETGIAPDPRAPIAGYVRAVAKTGNRRAQRLLARMKAALPPAL